MCEIASMKADVVVENAESIIPKVMNAMYHGSNDDGFGLLAVYVEEDDTFSYKGYKGGGSNLDAEESDFIDWTKNQSDAWRIIAHARLATSGDRGFEEAHPIHITDDDVDAKFIIHNGVVHAAKYKREQLEDEGHEFNTEVDTEVIAHEYDDIPTDIDEFEQSTLSGNLNYLLFSEDSILIRNDGKYSLTSDLRMSCRTQWVSDDMEENDLGRTFSLYTLQDGTLQCQTKDVDTKVYSSVTKSGQSSSWGSVSHGQSRATGSRSWSGYRVSSRDSVTRSDYPSAKSIGATLHSEHIQEDDTVFMSTAFSTSRSGGRMYDSMGSAEGFEISAYKTEVLDNGVICQNVNPETDDQGLVVEVLKQGRTNKLDGVEGAVVVVSAIDTTRGSEQECDYPGTGKYLTDESGRIVLPTPGGSRRIMAYVIQLPVGAQTGDSNGDDSDGDGEPALSDEVIAEIDYWFPYGDRYSEIGGWCSIHYEEYTGSQCTQCVQQFSRAELVDASGEDLWGTVGDGLQSSTHS